MNRASSVPWIVVLTFSFILSHAAAADEGELLELLLRPIPRLALSYTEPGAELAEKVLGRKIVSEADLSRMAHLLEGQGGGEELAARLRALESDYQHSLGSGEAPEGAFSLLEDKSIDWLALGSVSEGEGASGTFHFVSEVPSGDFAGARDRFLGMEDGPGRVLAGRDLGAANLEGADLRFADLRRARLGNLRGADLRGADLRGAILRDGNTRLDGAVYDQFTAMNLSRAEASRRGMVYRPSSPPEGFLYQNLESAARGAARSGATPPTDAEAERIATRALRALPESAPGQARGVRLFDQPRYVVARGKDWVRFEAGAVRKGEFGASADAVIDELSQSGGELRRLVAVRPETGEAIDHGMAYFRTEGETAVISVSPKADAPTLFHEREHFRDWKELLRGLREDRGLSPAQALKEANRIRSTGSWAQFTERHAIIAEFKAQAALDDAAGVPLVQRKYRFESREFAARVTYPEREGVGRIFGKHDLSELRGEPALRSDLEDAERFMRKIIRTALVSRRAWYNTLGLSEAAHFSREELFTEVIAGNRSRYAALGCLEDVKAFFFELLPSEAERLPADGFREAVLGASS